MQLLALRRLLMAHRLQIVLLPLLLPPRWAPELRPPSPRRLQRQRQRQRLLARRQLHPRRRCPQGKGTFF